ncbi:MAG: MarR family transcriptional regulator [Propionibacteriales bacterium]|nr:MarR family transcriptional regulator [Propionibacteriales bacterium]
MGVADPPGRGRTAPLPSTGILVRRAYVRAVECARQAIPEPHHVRHLAVLSMLKDGGPLSQEELSAVAHVNRTLVVKLVDGLEERGLVERRRDPHDRRRYALFPTKDGLDLLDRLQPALDAADSQLTQSLTRAEQRRLKQLLRSLVAEDDDPLVESLADRAGYLVSRAHGRMRTQATDALGPLDMAPRHFGALSILSSEQPCSQQHLAVCLGISPPAVVPFVDEMEDAGLIKRTRNPRDRRAYDLTLTPKGGRRLSRAQNAARGMRAGIEQRLGPDGEQELRELLGKLVGAVSGRRDL